MNLKVETTKKAYRESFANYGVIASVLTKIFTLKMLLFELVVTKLQKICKSLGLSNAIKATKWFYFK